MKKCQVLSEFIILGAILFVLLLVLSYKIETARVLCYIRIEYNLKKSTILSNLQNTPAPVLHKSKADHPFEDKILLTTEYFSYYIPANIKNMAETCGKYRVQHELLNSVLQVIKQLKSHKICYNAQNDDNLKKSIDDYIKYNNNSNFTNSKKQLNNNLEKFKSDLLIKKSPVANEGVRIIQGLVKQIMELNKNDKKLYG